MDNFTISTTIKRTAEELYQAWLDSEKHSAMTGSAARCSAEEGGQFTAWDGYISGSNISLVPNSRIVQNWRTTDFLDDDKSSRVEIEFKEVPDGCELILSHTNIPEDQPDYKEGWYEYYFYPMLKYFRK
jgi:activator of HSP90 ATPase